MDTNKNYPYIKYNDFWQNSLQRLESIIKNVEQNLNNLERKYCEFDEFYDKIITEVDILASIYSSHNNLKGRDYILKLKALLSSYQKRYTHKGIDFKVINFLNTKINLLREQSFENFPQMEHSVLLYKDISGTSEIHEKSKDILKFSKLKSSAKFKWITFSRNGSWFVSQYDKFQIVEQKADETNNSIIKIKSDGKFISVTDLLSHSLKNKKEKINSFLVIKLRDNLACYAVSRLGKIIMADKDFIAPNLKSIIKNKISPGKFRIFGKNHIYL
ncbi:MAG: hypothetical protein V1874_17245 [Spirochaetota bacterium]